MRILFDACVPRPLRQLLPGHSIKTAQEMGWAELKNGALIAAAESKFDALVTTDQNLKHQQNLSGRNIAILVLPTNDWPEIRRHAPEIAAAANSLTPGAFEEIHWGSGFFPSEDHF